MAEQVPGQEDSGSAGPERGPGEKKVSRRTFIGLALGGAAALALGGWRLAASHLTGGGSATTTAAAFNVADFTIQRVASDPKYQPDQWRLTVYGMVDQDLSLTLDKFLALPQVNLVRDFQCVEGWKVYQCPWEGVTVRQIMDLAGIKPQAKYLVFWSDDGVYSDTLSVDQASRPDIILAHMLDGKELAPGQGWPVRLVVPGNYGYKYVKWVGRIQVTDQKHTGYWEGFGYPDDASIPGGPTTTP
jgi:DMSO/TMAO reductase YedYZ molybdopterin-dependent catalytic subunit